jgi:hypothetical protein
MAYSLSDAVGGFDNNGDFKRVCNWTADKNAGVKILAERMDLECDNFALGFNNCITRDMKGKPTADFNFNGFASLNLATKLAVEGSAVNVKNLITDPTRLFYDSSTLATTIILSNAYMSTLAVNANEGYHFFFTVNNTINTKDLQITFQGSTILNSLNVVGPDSAQIEANTLQEDGVYEAVITVDPDTHVKQICVLNAIPVGVSSSDGSITSAVAADGSYNLAVNTSGLNFITDVYEGLTDKYIEVEIPEEPAKNKERVITLNYDTLKADIAAVQSVQAIQGELCILVDNGTTEHPTPLTPKLGLDLDETYRRLSTDADLLMAHKSIWTTATSTYTWGNMAGLQTALDVFGDLIVDGRFPTFTFSGSSDTLNTDLNPVFKFAGKGMTFTFNMTASTANAWGTIAPQDQGSGTIIFDGGAGKANVRNFTFDNNNGATYILKNINFFEKDAATTMSKPAIIIKDNCTVIIDETCSFLNGQFGTNPIFQVSRGTLKSDYTGQYSFGTYLVQTVRNATVMLSTAADRSYIDTDGTGLIITGQNLIQPVQITGVKK